MPVGAPKASQRAEKEKQNEKTKGADLLPQGSSQRLCNCRAVSLLSDQGSNLDFLESKSSVLPVTPSDNFPLGGVPFWDCKGSKRMIPGKGLGKKN